jgi:DNA-binding NarL/FixJ family response regulator
MDKKLKIAFADDNVLHLKVIEHLAREMGNYEMLYACHNGKELLHLLETNMEQPDVCILDLHMPEMDGIALSQIIKKQFPTMKILIVSMHEETKKA